VKWPRPWHRHPLGWFLASTPLAVGALAFGAGFVEGGFDVCLWASGALTLAWAAMFVAAIVRVRWGAALVGLLAPVALFWPGAVLLIALACSLDAGRCL
jgi:hypothetical protein